MPDTTTPEPSAAHRGPGCQFTARAADGQTFQTIPPSHDEDGIGIIMQRKRTVLSMSLTVDQMIGLRDALDQRIEEAVMEPRRRALRGEDPRPGTADGSAS